MFDCCMNHARLWDETQGGKLPASEHAPSCPNYKTKLYKRVRLNERNGASFIDTEKGAAAFIAESDDPGEYIIEDVYLTEDQFEKLPDFEGF